ncbi:MAG: Fic family protein [Verrucomicrobiota bacterium]
MEPLLPTQGKAELTELACELLRTSGRLSGMLHLITRQSMAELLRAMNSYYSNLIEGHRTNPYDIEKAIKHDFSRNPEQKALQQESVAHIRVQMALEKKLGSETNAFSQEFICWLHAEFYKHLPDSFRLLKDDKGRQYEVVPGKIRQDEVYVGRHIAPHHQALPAFMERFASFYGNDSLAADERILAIAASHHRLAWLHPFMDGNGRVVRLFSHALFIKNKVDADGLWAISRGLARSRDGYMQWLDKGDTKRENDYNGRGRMSDKALSGFCKFFLTTALDQVSFMSKLLDFDSLEKRIERYLATSDVLRGKEEDGKYLLWEALRKGEFQRGQAGRITNKPERTARDILKALVGEGLLVSDTEKSPVRLGFPVRVLEFYFPLLYPQGAKEEQTSIIGLP